MLESAVVATGVEGVAEAEVGAASFGGAGVWPIAELLPDAAAFPLFEGEQPPASSALTARAEKMTNDFTMKSAVAAGA